MVTDMEIGKYLAYIRDKAGLKQNELAEKVGWSAPVLSRVESGERPTTTEERDSILKSIGTEEAINLQETIERDWHNLPRPRLGHPDESLLWKADQILSDIDELSKRLDIRVAFANRLEESRTEIWNAANLVYRTEHSIAFLGDIGVGKSTAICRVAELEVQNERTGEFSPMLEVGAGGITVCEVHLVEGPDYGLVIEPKSDSEIQREVREFAILLKNPPESDQEDDATEPDSFGTSKEIERAIRNMSGLTRRVRRYVGRDGKTARAYEDPARELADKSADANACALEILAKMGLDKRTRRELWYPNISGKKPLIWLQEIFNQVNNGRHPEFSIPSRIEIIVPQAILGSDLLSIRLIDTKGIDRTAIRDDIKSHFREPNTVVVLCSGFNATPAQSVQRLLERAIEDRLTDLQYKGAILALPRYDEALAVKYDEGFPVENTEEGYELKREQAEMALIRIGVSNMQVMFFNAREDDPLEFRDTLMSLVNGLRAEHCKFLSDVIASANTLVQNFEEQQVLEVQAQAARRLMLWIQSNKNIDTQFSPLERSLIRAINSAHASSLRASVRREGDWYNLEYSPQLGFGARRMAINAIHPLREKFNTITENLLQDPELEEAFDLVQQTQRIMESGIESLLQKCRLLGRTIHIRDMKISVDPWYSSNNEWGKGIVNGKRYRDRVSDHHEEWFNDKNPQERVENLIQSEWQQIMNRMADILDTDEG